MFINPIWFYLIGLSTKLMIALFGLAILFFVSAVIAALLFSDAAYGNSKKIFKITLIASLICLLVGLVIPTKSTCYQMMIASNVHATTLEQAKNEVIELAEFIIGQTTTDNSYVEIDEE